MITQQRYGKQWLTESLTFIAFWHLLLPKRITTKNIQHNKIVLKGGVPSELCSIDVM